MSHQVLPNVGLQRLADMALQTSHAIQLHCRLYKAITIHSPDTDAPGPSTVIGNITEANFAGYNPDGGGFFPGFNAATIVTPDDVGRATASSVISFVCSGGGTTNTVLGYYLTEDGIGGNQVVSVERFDTPVIMAVLGDTINITPRMDFGSLFSAP